MKNYAKFGPKLNPVFQISPKKIGKFLWRRWRGSKFQILLLSFVWKVNWLSQKTLRRVSFFDTEGSWNVWAKPESSFPNQPTKNWSICLELPKRLQISYFICFVCLKGKLAEPENLYKSSFCDTKGPCKHWAKTECCFPNQPPRNWAISLECAKRVQISNFIGFFVWKLSCLKERFSQQIYFVTLKGCGMCWPKLKAAFQISPPKYGKFLSSRWIGSKSQILLLSFLWKVNWLSQKTLRRVSFFDTEGSWNVWAKPESSFPNQPTKNWSICLELPKRLQISYFICFVCLKGKLAEPENLYKSSFCDTKGPCKRWAKTECCFSNQPTKSW